MAVQYMRRVIEKKAKFDIKNLNCLQVCLTYYYTRGLARLTSSSIFVSCANYLLEGTIFRSLPLTPLEHESVLLYCSAIHLCMKPFFELPPGDPKNFHSCFVWAC